MIRFYRDVLGNGKGVYTKMKDGSILSYREVSSSDGSPAVEMNKVEQIY